MEEDMITEIFLHLPQKSLSRCKCLSKSWNCIISSDSSFIHAYYSRHSKIPSRLMLGFFLQRYEYSNLAPAKIEFLPTCDQGKIFEDSSLGHQETFVVACSNGFLLLCSQKYIPKNYFIYNPITGAWVALPEPSMEINYVPTGFICQGSNGSCLSKVNYKIVRAVFGLFQFANIEIFSSDSFQWMVLNVNCPCTFVLESKPYVVLTEDGLVHWLGWSYRDRATFVFDQRKGRVHHARLREAPPALREWFSQTDGVVTYASQSMFHIELWMLKEDLVGGKQWLRKYRVDLAVGNHNLNYAIMLGPSPFNLAEVFIYNKGYVATYNLKNSRMEILGKFDDRGWDFVSHYIFYAYELGLACHCPKIM